MIKSQEKWLRYGVEQFALRYINLLILFLKRRNCLRSGKSRSLYLSIRRTIKQTVVIIEAYHFCKYVQKFYRTSSCQGSFHKQRILLGINNVDSEATSQPLIILYSAFVIYLRKNGNPMKRYFSSLQTSRELLIQSWGRSCKILSLSLVPSCNW
jgi:hypothetical protein